MNPFDASSSILGYLYQERYCLLLGVRKAGMSPASVLSLEMLDDIGLQDNGATNIIQVKATTSNITSGSEELWKTLRVWAEGIQQGRFNPGSATFLLVTTAKASDGSAPGLLRDDGDRDTARALMLLNDTADKSTNESLVSAFAAFKKLSPRLKQSLVNEIYVVDNEPSITAARELLKYELRFAAKADRIDHLLNKLEGWWHNKVIGMLLSTSKTILVSEIEYEIASLRREFDELNLPIDFTEAEPSEGEVRKFRERQFVQQLRLINANQRIVDAIRDYYKAYQQRSKWIRDSLLYIDGLTAYDRRLKNEWGRKHREVLDELGASDLEEDMIALGNNLYSWAINVADYRVVPNCSEPYVMRGSFHMLSDKEEIGWHPNYVAKLKALLQAKSA